MPVAPDIVARILMRDRVKLLAFIHAMVGDRHLAEDAMQEVAARAIRRADSIDDEHRIAAWARSAARHVAAEMLRARGRGPMLLDDATLDLVEARWGQIDDLRTDDLAEALDACVAELSPYARQLIDCRYGRDLTGARLADALGRKSGSVSVALSRIHRTLGRCIRKRLGRPDPNAEPADA